MSAEDRNSLVILKRWARNPAFLDADVTICLISENQVEVNQGIVQHPGVSSIEIPLPDYGERLEFIRAQLKTRPLPAGSEVTDESLAKLGAGLKRVQLQSLIAHAVENRQPLTLKTLAEHKKELIEAESGGLLEFVQSRFDLSFVAGNDQAKRKLQDAAAAIQAGNTDVLPMGYVICGPVGTGKTFITTCFAGEVGLSGEIRAVNRVEQRIAEAEKLGFEKIIVSKYNQKGLEKQKFSIEIVTLGRIDELYKYLF